MDILKEGLVAPPVLTLSQRDRQYNVKTDACDTQAGNVLLQEQEDKPWNP